METLKRILILIALLTVPTSAWSQHSHGGVATPESFTLTWDGALGGLTNAAVAPMTAPCTGTFTDLACTATLTGACTTGPTINVKNITGATTGTSVAPTTTVATVAHAVETLAVTQGNTIGLAQTATTSVCTAPTYHCTATLSCPS